MSQDEKANLGITVADTERPPNEEVVEVVDENCFLCVGLPKEPSGGIEAPTYFFAYGFAEGVSQALRSAGYHFCDRHAAVIRKACLEKGINWGKPMPQRKILI